MITGMAKKDPFTTQPEDIAQYIKPTIINKPTTETTATIHQFFGS